MDKASKRTKRTRGASGPRNGQRVTHGGRYLIISSSGRVFQGVAVMREGRLVMFRVAGR